MVTVMAFGNRQMIAGENREKEKKAEECQQECYFTFQAQFGEGLHSLCKLSFGEGKREKFIGEDKPFSFLILQ